MRFSPAPRLTRRLAAAVMVAVFALTACGSDANDDLAQRASNDGSNYIAGDGSVQEFAPENRGESVAFESETFDGEPVSGETFQGEVTVINFWYAACAPCRKEAPDLQEIYEEFEPDGVQFYGVNTRDTQATAEAFERNFGITYPSMEDRGGTVLMSMTDYVHPSAVPTTLVLDQEGRVTARISGIVEPGTLRALITTALEEDQAQAEAGRADAAGTLPTT
ncbi:TlpA family protein disulfide reductase [Nesterenkonia haasae]|uniref:TlpA family protein disulfide reductase n=1 Tax=Nesterenkonia haasae TaxID=2587813 RepID=UPI0038B413D5